MFSKYRRQQAAVERLKREQAQREEARRPPRPWLQVITDGVFRDVQAWIAAKLAGTRILHIRIVDPPPCDIPPPRLRPEPEPRGTEPVAPRAPVEEPPNLDPHGYERMSVEELHVAGRQSMPAAQRLELERVLNAKIKARRAPTNLSAEEHERLSRMH